VERRLQTKLFLPNFAMYWHGGIMSRCSFNQYTPIVFISPPDVKDAANPRSGIATAVANEGQYFDPWGTNYVVRIDGDYNNQWPILTLRMREPLPRARSYRIVVGKDQLGGVGSADKNAGTAADERDSWQ